MLLQSTPNSPNAPFALGPLPPASEKALAREAVVAEFPTTEHIEAVDAAFEQYEDIEHLPVPASSAPPKVSAFEWFFVVAGGAVLFLPLILWFGEEGLGRNDRIRWYFWISALISSPHVYATYVRLHRKVREGRIHWTVGFPTYFASAGILGLASYAGYFVEVMTFVNVWQSLHYVRQSYGVSCFYGRQPQFDDRDRLIRWWAYHLTFPALILGRWDTLFEVWQGKTYSFIPMHIGIPIMSALWIIAAAGVYLAVLAEGRLLWKNRSQYRPISLVCFVAFLAVHFYGFVMTSHFNRGFFTVTIYHAVQYLAIVWAFEHKKGVQLERRWATQIPKLLGFAAFWLILFALGYGYEQHVVVALNSLWVQSAAVLLAAISVHHYITDTFIWRRSVGA